ncbi:MAG: 4Fe-4S dicluster domain-containing protein, partial [Candidatus Bipolaricaulia bacterium]
HSGEPIRRCFQCDRCATGCPMASYMQHTPNELFRLIQLGVREAVLSSNAFWFCVSCYTCSVRCPNDIDIAHVMDTLRELSLREGFTPTLPQARDFHKLFLDCVRRSGRVSELELMARYNLKLRKPFSRIALGWELLRKGRLELWPKRTGELRKIFKALTPDPSPVGHYGRGVPAGQGEGQKEKYKEQR